MLLLNIAQSASEMNIESLIRDLAFILLLGAVVTVLFKWIKQPVVLGYIVAGFLASPNFEPLPSVTTEANIEFWAQIGIVVLLFSLGLEFSFKKLMNVGGSAVTTALIIVIGMMCTGFIVGHFLGFTHINSLFLGGMLSMSSTTIIIKAFNDLGLQQKKFAGLVFAVLIVEDLFAVLMMVLLSSIAINNSVEGTEMLMSVTKLAFFLVIWFLVGVYMIPSLLNLTRRYLSDETLLIISMGMCLGMAVFSVLCGFSLALGAFVMGSILAGTSYAERIEHVTVPVKDLFGSVFFISVGMMVQPDIIAEYWQPILILSLAVIIGMILFGTTGMLVTGQSLKVAIESGFSLTQIGEFAFIIASLGMSLGVLEKTIYPIVVAVSVITTFTTPYFIKMSGPAYLFLERHLPRRLLVMFDRYSEESRDKRESTKVWSILLRRYIWRIIIYAFILTAIILVTTNFLYPWLESHLSGWGKLVAALISLAAMSPFLMALSMPTSQKSEREILSKQYSHYRVPLVVMSVFKLLIALAFVVYLLAKIYSVITGFFAGTIILILILFVFSRQITTRMKNIETKFLNNLNERELRRSGKNNNLVDDLHLAYMTVGYGCPFVGERLMDSPLRSEYLVSVVFIQRGGRNIPVPSGHTRLFPGDTVGIIGNDAAIEHIIPLIECDALNNETVDISDFKIRDVELTQESPIIGQSIMKADIRKNYQAHIVAVSRNNEFVQELLNQPLEVGDIVWVVADRKSAENIAGTRKSR